MKSTMRSEWMREAILSRVDSLMLMVTPFTGKKPRPPLRLIE
jgi:hypothetical protein